MKANRVVKKTRGRPRGSLRQWYTKNLPKMKPVSVNKNVLKEVEVLVPEFESNITIDVPKGYTVIPPELTDGKTQATVGQTARNETRELGIDDKRFIVHEMSYAFEDKKNTYEFSVFAVEPVEVVE